MFRRPLALAALAVVGLTGCAASTPSSPATVSPAAEAPASSATPESEAPVPAELVVRGAGVELYGSDGVLMGSFVWADETETALEVLELAFGPAPTPGTRTGDGFHYANYDRYDFMDFSYFTATNLEKPRDEYFLPSSVQVDTGEPINGVSIRTLDDLRVGGTLAQVLALSPEVNYPDPLGTAYLVDAVDPSLVAVEDDFTDMVAAIVDPDGTLVRIAAPYLSRWLF